MHNYSYSFRIDLDKILFALFCLYALSMPFELILEKLLSIKTIFKPFRVFSLLILATYSIIAVKRGIIFNHNERGDFLLYAVFVYGFLASCVQIVIGFFNTSLFFNDLFLVGLNVLTFFVYKTTHFSKEQTLKILRCFVIGICLNASYLIYPFLIKSQFGRQSGFVDNPNYAALGLVIAMAYLVLHAKFKQSYWGRLLYIFLFLFLTYIFIVTGSRAGLAIFLLILFFIFLFSSFRRKMVIALLTVVVTIQLVAMSSSFVSFGGPLVLINRVVHKMGSETEDVRFIIWRGVFRVLEDKGYWGMGIGQFKANFAKYYSEESNKLILEIVNRGYYLSPHNDYLAILADYGIPALVLYLSFLAVVVRKTWRKLLYPTEDAELLFLNRFQFMILLSLIVFGMSAENFQSQLFWFLMMFSTKTLR